MATARRRVGLGVVRKISSVDKAHLKKSLEVKNRQAQENPWHGPPCGPGRECPALPVLLATP